MEFYQSLMKKLPGLHLLFRISEEVKEVEAIWTDKAIKMVNAGGRSTSCCGGNSLPVLFNSIDSYSMLSGSKTNRHKSEDMSNGYIFYSSGTQYSVWI